MRGAGSRWDGVTAAGQLRVLAGEPLTRRPTSGRLPGHCLGFENRYNRSHRAGEPRSGKQHPRSVTRRPVYVACAIGLLVVAFLWLAVRLRGEPVECTGRPSSDSAD